MIPCPTNATTASTPAPSPTQAPTPPMTSPMDSAPPVCPPATTQQCCSHLFSNPMASLRISFGGTAALSSVTTLIVAGMQPAQVLANRPLRSHALSLQKAPNLSTATLLLKSRSCLWCESSFSREVYPSVIKGMPARARGSPRWMGPRSASPSTVPSSPAKS